MIRYGMLINNITIDGIGMSYVIIKAGFKGQIVSETSKFITLLNDPIEVNVDKSNMKEISVNDFAKKE